VDVRTVRVRPRRVAAIDCGTNSLRLLVVDRSGAELLRRTEIVRLGQDVDRTARLAPEALERTSRVLAQYAAAVRWHEVERVRVVATSATRDAANRAEFTELVRNVVGVDPDVISGEEEAALSFTGVVGALPDLSGRLLVADVGGGSTELVAGSAERPRPRWARSMAIGSVRLTERYLRDDPPTPGQIETTVRAVRAAIADLPSDRDGTVVAVAGTATTLAALALNGSAVDPASVHGVRLASTTLAELTDRLLAMPRAERAAMPGLHPRRADVIGAGGLIMTTVLSAVGAAELVISLHDILDGITAGLLAD
jgi:exopolyphosphatase / guanosine-5'-triphosphate,3'-diphosphate pyrophosphatase